MYCKFISQPKQYLNDPYCQEMCLDMHAKYDCVSSMQKWIGKMMDKKNSLGRSCHLSTTWHSRNSLFDEFFFLTDFFIVTYSVVSIKRTGSLNYFEVFYHPELFFHVLNEIFLPPWSFFHVLNEIFAPPWSFFHVLNKIFAPPCSLITSCSLNRYYRVILVKK